MNLKRILFSVLSFFISCLASAQVDTLLLSPDAILEPADSIMIDDWLYLAQYAEETDSAISYAHAAFFIAKQIESEKGQIQSLRFLAPAYLSLGENTKGLRKYLQLVNLLNRTYRWDELYEVNNKIADFFSSQSQWSNALLYREKAYDLAMAHHLIIDFIPLYKNLASLSKEADQFSEALGYWSNIDSMASLENDTSLFFESAHSKVSIYYDMKDVVNALAEIEKLTPFVAKSPKHTNVYFPEYWTLLPILYLDIRLPEKALYWLDVNESYSDSVQFYSQTLEAFKMLRGIIYLQINRSEQAVDLFWELYNQDIVFSDEENWSAILFDLTLLGDMRESNRSVDQEKLDQLNQIQNKRGVRGYQFPLTPVCVYLQGDEYAKAYNSFRDFMTYVDSLEAEFTLISVEGTGTLPSVPYIWVRKQIASMKEQLFSDLLQESKLSILSRDNQKILYSLQSLWDTYLDAKENRLKAASRVQQLQAENKRLAESERELLERNRIKELELLEEANRNQTLTIEKDKAVRHRLLLILVSVLLIAGLAIYSWRQVKIKNGQLRESREIIRLERDKSDNLLLNILPASTADELKLKGFATSNFYDEVSILFTDFSGFTHLAEGLKAGELVEQLNEYFKEFDQIVDSLGLEKIKTIGDSYMCAGGLPNPYDGHVVKIVEAAFRMREITQSINKAKQEKGDSPWPLRIGIHSGPVVAGVIGTKKFAYDIWGDSVNVAARMEQTSSPGKVNISENIKFHLNGSYSFEERGEIEAKNKGKIKMFFVERAHPKS